MTAASASERPCPVDRAAATAENRGEMSAPASPPQPAPTDDELIRALAALAGLPLAPAQAEALAGLAPVLHADHAQLRFQPGDLEPHTVFDPRWD